MAKIRRRTVVGAAELATCEMKSLHSLHAMLALDVQGRMVACGIAPS